MNIALYSFAEFVYDYEFVKLNGLLREAFFDKALLFYILAAIWIAASYFLGGLNFAILVSKKLYNDDVRTHGSGNAGFTNMRRTYGMKVGALVFLGDLLKTIIAVLGAMLLFGRDTATLAGLACILGHCYPCFFSFKGGKGIATIAAMVLVLDPVVFLVLFVIFAIIVLSSKYLSLGSVMAVLLYPLLLRSIYNFIHTSLLPEYFIKHGLYETVETLDGAVTSIEELTVTLNHSISAVMILVAVFIAAFITFKHRENIKRIMAGNENKFYLSSKHKKSHIPEDVMKNEKSGKTLHRIDEIDEELNGKE